MALTTSFEYLKSLLDNIGSSQTITIVGGSGNRGSNFISGSGITISRSGNITGSASGGNVTITLEGGGAQWEGALTQDNVEPYYTRAQLTLVSSLKQYVSSMSNAVIDEQY